MKNWAAIVVVLFMFSCNQKENNKIIPVNSTDTIVTEKDSGSVRAKEENQQIADTINLTFEDDKGNYIAEGTIDSIHPRIYIKFTNDDTGILKATVKPLGVGNIRFNQIIFPDKRADGPFGQDLEMELQQTGEHTLIIGHSLMADDPYSGKFMVRLGIITRD